MGWKLNIRAAKGSLRLLLDIIIFSFHAKLWVRKKKWTLIVWYVWWISRVNTMQTRCYHLLQFSFRTRDSFWANRETRSAPDRPVVATADWPRLRNGQKASPAGNRGCEDDFPTQRGYIASFVECRSWKLVNKLKVTFQECTKKWTKIGSLS